jgi:adenylate cyclase
LGSGRHRNDNSSAPEKSEQVTPSIAVLASANRSASADDEYFSDGLADELLNVLAKIKGLRVAARTSAFSFKGKSDDIATIGEKLNVATVLEGSVRKSGNRVRISVQLIKVNDGFQLWGETYDRALDDIFAVQDDIAQAVVTELRAALLGDGAVTSSASVAKEIQVSTRSRSDNPEAQRLILQARFYRQKRRGADIKRSIAFSEEALALDPQYADAHASLSFALHLMSVYGAGKASNVNTAKSYLSRSRAAAVAALALDQTLALPHIILSWLDGIGEHDQVAAMREAKLAQALAPHDAEALRTLGNRLMGDGQFSEAEAMFARAAQLDPLSITLRSNYSVLAQFSGRPQEALHRVREAIAIDESYWIAHWQLSSVLSELGEYADAAEATAQSCAVRGEHERASFFREQFAVGGWKAYLAAIIEAPHYVAAPIQIARAQAKLGLMDDAFATLDTMVDHYDQHTLWLKHGSGLAPLRGDPRFHTLLQRTGFIG